MKIIITIATASIDSRLRALVRAVTAESAYLTASPDPDSGGVRVYDVEIQGAPDEIAQYLGL